MNRHRSASLRMIAPALAASLLLVVSGCASEHDDVGDAAGSPVVPVRVATIGSRVVRAEVVAPGQWRTTQELVVAAPFAALVEELRVEVGDRVARGQVLGTLVTRESRAAVLGAEQLVAGAGDAAARDEAARALRQAQRDVVRVPLVASASGTVLRRTAARGAEVGEGVELLALAPAPALVFEAHVPAADRDRVRVGQTARIVMEGGAALPATVSRTLPQTAAADQSALVWLAATPPAGAIDRFGSARILVGAERRVLAVPDSALVEDDLTGAVRVAVVGKGDVAIWVPVTLGIAADGFHELVGGALPAGARVVTSGQRGLPDSTHVALQP